MNPTNQHHEDYEDYVETFVPTIFITNEKCFTGSILNKNYDYSKS